jgi:hypothetical protein
MRQDVVKEHYKTGTQTEISLFFMHVLSSTRFVGYLKCFKTDVKIIFLHFMTRKFILQYAMYFP